MSVGERISCHNCHRYLGVAGNTAGPGGDFPTLQAAEAAGATDVWMVPATCGDCRERAKTRARKVKP